jgi:hypothetical protein
MVRLCSVSRAARCAAFAALLADCSDDMSGVAADAAQPDAGTDARTDAGTDAAPSTDSGSGGDATQPDTGSSRDGAGAPEASLDGGLEGAPDSGPGFLDASSDCRPDGGHGGHRWQDLYACYFGGTGVASCGSIAMCHGTATDNGTATTGFLCSPTDSTGCWQSTVAVLLPEGGTPDPTTTLLYTTLRKTDGTGSMPLLPSTLVFQTGDIARIVAWIDAGAPNN